MDIRHGEMLRFVLKCKQQRQAENVFDFVRKASYTIKIRPLLENCEEPFVIVNGSVKRYQLKKEKNRCSN